ncbi:hypothetical protein Taro_013409 [Colocasia esculenta]|uniref:PHD-type domain-containing protein n=1 Tax=Colocasia esculenta TaxID=4460 RepID=A0A843UFI0_COLES|nr:hypothetical protein [Colocasia esculenta]
MLPPLRMKRVVYVWILSLTEGYWIAVLTGAFCFACIDNWATITNLCPICKKEFQLITCLPVYDTIGNVKVDDQLLSRHRNLNPETDVGLNAQIPTVRIAYEMQSKWLIDYGQNWVDDDWYIQGKNNTLSFPSYYINEDAVICLDGDGCKVRNRLPSEEDLNLDTSIACDSCDIWYHAFCVGFDPEQTLENSWLCPRCIDNKPSHIVDGISEQKSGNQNDPRNAGSGQSVDSPFSGKVSISVADAGETAIVVSMVEGKPLIRSREFEQLESVLDTNTSTEAVASLVKDRTCSNQFEQCSYRNFVDDGVDRRFTGNTGVDQVPSESSLGLSSERIIIPSDSSMNDFFGSLSSLVTLSDGAAIHHDSERESSLAQSVSEVGTTVCDTFEDQVVADSAQQSNEGFSLSVDKLIKNGDENGVHVDCKNPDVDGSMGNHTDLLRSLLRKDVYVSDGVEKRERDSQAANGDCSKKEAVDERFYLRKDAYHAYASERLNEMEMDCLAATEDCGKKEELDEGFSVRKDAYASDQLKKRERDSQSVIDDHSMKEELDEGFCGAPQRRRMDTTIAIDPTGCLGMTSTSEDSVLKHTSVKEDCPSDIMSIVQDNNCKSSIKQTSGKINSEKSDGRPPGVGLRVKKIMRRVDDDKESLVLVQDLRNRIRETVSNEELSDIIKDGAFDEKLLSAFRAAIAGPRDKPVSKVVPSLVKGKKSLLQKGKVRENLTKKIYGSTNGRRRRAWDRDWEVEFWKHRCTSNKPEKVKTLQSVLDVLKKIKSSPQIDEMEQGPEKESANSVLSRVYLADSSVLPRTEDIKPLSAFTGRFPVGSHEQQEQNKCNALSVNILNANNVRTVSKISSNCSRSAVTSNGERAMTGNSGVKVETSCRKDQSVGSKIREKSYINASRNSEDVDKSPKESPATSDSARSDKRKWAMQVLARKNALANKDTSQMKEDNNPLLKENYPLLAQLPMDMRPTPAPSHHSKIPMPVRQHSGMLEALWHTGSCCGLAQLYRLTEHYLSRADVPVIQRTADVELAVADAVNIEKETCERSKSKLVYMNLCSQHIVHSKPQKVETVVSHMTSPSQDTEQVSSEQVPGEMTFLALGHDSVEDALRQAGLLSDSPDIPPQAIKQFDEEDDPVDVKEKDTENFLDLDPHPDLDIYGDFDYDLGDEDCGGPSSMNSCQGESRLHSEHGDLKMTVVLSAVSCERLNTSVDPKDDKTKILSFEKDQTANDLDMQRAGEADSCTLANHQHDEDAFQSMLKAKNGTLEDKTCEEPSWQECEELYGPAKEDLEKAVHQEATEATPGNMVLTDDKNDMSKNGAVVGEDENCNGSIVAGSRLPVNCETSGRENSLIHSLPSEHMPIEQISMSISDNKLSELSSSVSKKVEFYIKEHIRPLCKSGIITVEQYRWAVGKATDKVMRYHSKSKNANFLIKEGEKVKKLAEEYVESSQRKEWKPK